MADLMECGQIKDQNGKKLMVKWDKANGEIYVYRMGFLDWTFQKKITGRAKNAEEALAKAHAELHYG